MKDYQKELSQLGREGVTYTLDPELKNFVCPFCSEKFPALYREKKEVGEYSKHFFYRYHRSIAAANFHRHLISCCNNEKIST